MLLMPRSAAPRNSRKRSDRAKRKDSLDRNRCKGSVDNVDIPESARKHGVDGQDIVHAWENAS